MPAATIAAENAESAQFAPLYSQIKGLVLQAMQRGEFKPGQAMPSEMELAARFKVSQGTVRKAIDELAASKHVVRKQGKGTYVASHNAEASPYRFLRLVPDVGTQAEEGPAQREILSCDKQRCTADVARALQLKPGDAVMVARRLLRLGRVPSIVEDLWLPLPRFKGLTAEMLLHHAGSTYGLYERGFNTQVLSATEKIRATSADEITACLLQVPVGTPLLSVERIALTFEQIPAELRRAVYRTDTHHYHNALN